MARFYDFDESVAQGVCPPVTTGGWFGLLGAVVLGPVRNIIKLQIKTDVPVSDYRLAVT